MAAGGDAWASPSWETGMHRLTLTLLDLPVVAVPGTPVPVRVRLRNEGDSALSGKVLIAGPTDDITPLGATEIPFRVEAAQTFETAFSVAVSKGAVRGDYPIHAFAEISGGGEGMLRVARVLRVDFPEGPETALAVPAGEGKAVDLVLPGELSGLNGLLERWRLDALMDYIRTEDEPVEGAIFRMGSAPDAFRVAVIPGDQGLLDGWFLVAGPEPHRLSFHGLRLTVRLPAGVVEEGPSPPLEVDLSKPDGGSGKGSLAYEHYLSCGAWGTMVRIEVRGGADGVEIRATSQDEIVSLGIGSTDPSPVAMIGGRGIRVETAALGAADAARNELRGAAIALEFPGNMHLLASALGPLAEMRLAPNLRSPGVMATRSEGIRLFAGPNSSFGTVAQIETKSSAASGSLQRLWLDLEVPGSDFVRDRLAELQRYDQGPKGVILRHRAIEPPEKFRELEDFLHQSGYAWGFDEESSEISPLSESFDYADVAFGPGGDPIRGRSGRYLLRPDRLRSGTMAGLAKPDLLVLGPCDALSGGFSDRRGHWFPPAAMKVAWERTMSSRRSALPPGGWLLARSTGSWVPTMADGVILPPVDVAAPLVPVPWSTMESPRVLRPFPDGAGPKAELAALLTGEALVTGHRDWGREMVRRAWYLRPILSAISGTALSEVKPSSPSHDRLQCRRGPDTECWTNWTAQPWEIGGHRLAPWGFRVAASGLEAGRKVGTSGEVIEHLETPASRYVHVVDSRPTEPPCPSDCRWELLAEGMARVEVDWNIAGPLPHGTRPILLLFSGSNPGVPLLQVDLHAASPPAEWFGRVVSGAEFSLDDLAVGTFPAALALVTPTGRPLALSASRTITDGPYRGYAGRAGQLKIERIEDGVVEELAFMSELDAGGRARPPESRKEALPLTDVGWASTNGGFRLEKTKAGFLLVPLPDSAPFEIRLRPVPLDFTADRLVSVRCLPLDQGEPTVRPPSMVDGEVRLIHEPGWFGYELVLR